MLIILKRTLFFANITVDVLHLLMQLFIATLNAEIVARRNVAKVTQRIARLLLEKIVHTECHARFDQPKVALI